jgi:hypothetical protein
MRGPLGGNNTLGALRQRTSFAGLLLTAAVNCAPTASRTSGASPASEDAHIDGLIAALDTVQGEFRDVGHLIFVFESESRVLEELAAYNEVAIPKLVDCLGYTSFARATADYTGRLRLGTLCGQALVYTDYFQTRQSAGLWPQWFSDSLPEGFGAEPEELRRAQRAWRAYLATNPLSP